MNGHRGSGPWTRPVVQLWALGIALAIVTVVLVHPPLAIVLVGLLPAAVVWVHDRTPEKHLALCVGSLNFAGLAALGLEAVRSGPRWFGTFLSSLDANAWLVMFGGAAAGWVIHAVLPPVLALLAEAWRRHRVHQLKTAQRELVEEWGPEVGALPAAADPSGATDSLAAGASGPSP